MGRINGALAQHNPTKTLAQWLESLRRRSGLSWSQMAQTASEMDLRVSRSTLFRAAQDEKLPRWKTVQAFTRACGGDEREAKRLWARADRCGSGPTGEEPRIVVLPAEFITEPWQIVQAMKRMRREHGNPTLRELEKRAYIDLKNKVSLLPRSTVGAVLRGRMPAKNLLLSFVRYCGNIPESQLQGWEDAWERANAFRKGELRTTAAEMPEELARVQDELKRTREQLEQATTELARTARQKPMRVVLPPLRPAELVPSLAHSKKNGPPPQAKMKDRQRRSSRRTLRAG
ncbi:hypothetical protein ACWD5R_45450 [Streptomyces sp. NPDC002514]|uniref:hypothetical protein n=1 Tax=Streptomyces sp. NPDC001270 TaxID=3364554 RepID=UPI0036D1E60C